jgi:hypothetical protein
MLWVIELKGNNMYNMYKNAISLPLAGIYETL